MTSRRFAPLLCLAVVASTPATVACVRSKAVDKNANAAPAPVASAPVESPVDAASVDVGASTSSDDLVIDAALTDAPWSPPPASSIDGPHEDLSVDAGRPVYYAFARHQPPPLRLIGHLHGMCAPPVYACGRWIGAGTEAGVMVCPTGNARCGDSPVGPASWEATTWPELVAAMDADLETAIAKVEKKRPGLLQRDGAVLTGYSRGAFAAPSIARRHPGRWPYLILIEANVGLTKESLLASGVRAVALVAGELGTEITGMRKTERDLTQDGIPAKLFVMRKTGHPYSEDMEQVMHDALAFVLRSTP